MYQAGVARLPESHRADVGDRSGFVEHGLRALQEFLLLVRTQCIQPTCQACQQGQQIIGEFLHSRFAIRLLTRRWPLEIYSQWPLDVYNECGAAEVAMPHSAYCSSPDRGLARVVDDR